jgi:hypothetical protein
MMDVQAEQLKVLDRTLRQGASASYARHAGIIPDMSYDVFRANVPLITYDDLGPWVARCKSGEGDVLWPGIVRQFAVSAGTTGLGKHIPIYEDRLRSDLRFMRRVMRRIIRDNPDPGMFLGRHVALSGSVESVDGIDFGEISGMLACASPKWIRLWHSQCPQRSAFMKWPDRFESIIINSMMNDVRVITGVPSWILILLREVSARSGQPIDHIWPNLRLIVTGGVALSGYIDAIQAELGALNVRFMENYGASEGYFASDWFDEGSLRLQYDTDVLFEFIPIETSIPAGFNTAIDSTRVVPLWNVKPNVRYGLVVSNMGLWRYVTNDEIMFTSTNPPRICITGRLNEMTDTFGEAVSASDVREVHQRVIPSIKYNHFHVRPAWSGIPPLPMHEWILVIADPAVRYTLTDCSFALTDEIDQHLRSINRHYAIRRETGAMGLPLLRIIGLDEYETIIRALPQSQSKLGLFLRD